MTLIQCPFCGGNAHVSHEVDSEVGRCWFIECEKCYSKGPEIVENVNDEPLPPEKLYYAIEKAVKIAADDWNRRI